MQTHAPCRERQKIMWRQKQKKKKREFGSKEDTVFVIASKCCIGITIKGLMIVSLTLERLGIMFYFFLQLWCEATPAKVVFLFQFETVFLKINQCEKHFSVKSHHMHPQPVSLFMFPAFLDLFQLLGETEHYIIVLSFTGQFSF